MEAAEEESEVELESEARQKNSIHNNSRNLTLIHINSRGWRHSGFFVG